MVPNFSQIRKSSHGRRDALETYARQVAEAYPSNVLDGIPSERVSPDARIMAIRWRAVVKENFSTGCTLIVGLVVPLLSFFATEPEYLEFTTYHPVDRKKTRKILLVRFLSLIPEALGVTCLIAGIAGMVFGVVAILLGSGMGGSFRYWGPALGLGLIVGSHFLRRIAVMLSVPRDQRAIAQDPFKAATIEFYNLH